MKMVTTKDTEIQPTLDPQGAPGTFAIHQRFSGFRAEISRDVVDLIEAFQTPISVEDAMQALKLQGYGFNEASTAKLYNLVALLVQYGVLVVHAEHPTVEFGPVVKPDPNTVKHIDLAVHDLASLVGSIAMMNGNHPYPDNAMHRNPKVDTPK